MQDGHFSRNTLRDGVLELARKVGDVFGVVSGAGAVTMVSLGAGDGGSTGSLAWVVAETLAGASCFILARDLVGGIYSWTVSHVARRLKQREWDPAQQQPRVDLLFWWGGCGSSNGS